MNIIRTIALSINHHVITAAAKNFAYIGEDHSRIFIPSNKYKCTLATAVGVRVYPSFGFTAKPTVFEFEAIPDKNFQLSRPKRSNKKQQTEEPMWKGHLAPVVEGLIADSTAGQKADPESGLFIADCLVVPAEPGPDGSTEFMCDNGTIVRYRQQTDNKGYQDGDYWTHEGLISSLASFVKADVVEQLSGAPKSPSGSLGPVWQTFRPIDKLPKGTVLERAVLPPRR